MKAKRLLFVSGVCLALNPVSQAAATFYWDNSGGTANDWASLANWSTVIGGGTDPVVLPGGADIAEFSATSVTIAQTVNLNADRSLLGVTFSSGQAHTLLGGSVNRTLTLAGSGINKTGSGAVNIGSTTAGQQVAIALGADQTWTNSNAAGAISVFNGVSSNATGARVLTLDGTNTAANNIQGIIANGSGTVSLVKNGSGTWILNGANTFSGGVTINSGTLAISSAAGTGTSGGSLTGFGSGAVTLNGGTAWIHGSTSSFGTIANAWNLAGGTIHIEDGATTLSGSINVTANSVVQERWGDTITVSGIISGSGGLTFQRSATGTTENPVFVLSGANTTTGTITAGANTTVRLGNAAALGNTSAATTVTSGGVIDLNGQTIGAEPVTLNGTGLSSGGALINASSTAASLSGNISLASAASVGGVGTGAMTLSGIISGSNTLTKVGSGTTILSGANTYSGATTVSAGVLRLNGATSLPGGIGATGGTANLSLNGGVLGLGAGDFARGLGTGATQVQLAGTSGFAAYGAARTVNFGGANAAVTWGSGNFAPTTLLLSNAGADNNAIISNPIILGASARTVQVDNGTGSIDGELSGVLSGTGGSLVKTGAGTLALSGANTFDGGVNPKAGIVQLNSNAGAGTGTISFLSGDTGRIVLKAGVTIDNNINVNSGVTGVTGRGLIEQTGTGQSTINGTITVSGSPTNGGIVLGSNTIGNEIIFNGPINGVSMSQRDGRVIYKGGGTATGGFNVTGAAIVGATNGIPQGLTITLGGSAAASLELNGFDQTSAALVFGTAAAAHVGTVNLGSNTLTLNGGITTVGNSPAHVINATTGAGKLVLGTTNRAFNIGDSTAADDLTINNAVINGSGGFTKSGSGTLFLNGTTGDAPITLTAGTLRGAFTTTGGMTVNTGTTLVPGSTTSVGTINTSSLAFGSGTQTLLLNVGTAGTDLINVTASGGLTTSGGTTTINITPNGGFDNASTFYPFFNYTGTSPGLTGFSLGALPGHLTGSLTDSGTAIGLTATNDRIIWTGASSGAWDVNTTANWKLSSSAAATNFLSQDDIIFNDDGLSQSTVTLTTPAVYNPTRMEFSNTTGTYTLTGSGSIVGSGTMPLIKSGAGTVVLDGTTAHTYTGATTISAGTLAVNVASSNISATSGVDIASGATLKLFSNNADFTFNRNLTGSGKVVVDGNAAGTVGSRNLTLNGTNTGFSGTIELTPSGTLAGNGTFRLNATQSSLGTASVDVNDRAQLTISGTVTNNITLTGAGYQESAGGTPATTATGADGSAPALPALAYGGIGALRMDSATVAGNITLDGDTKIQAYNSIGTISGNITNLNSTDDLVVGGGGAGTTMVLTGDNSGLERIWVNGGGTTGTVTLVVGNNTTTGTLGTDDVILYQDAATAGIRFQRSDGYTLAAGQDIIAAHNGTASNLSKAFVQVNTTGTGLDIGGNTIDLSDGTNAGSINVGTNVSGASLTIGAGAVVQTGNFYVGENSGNSATVNQTGGAVSALTQVRIGHWGTETGTYNISGGTFDTVGASGATAPSGTGEQNGGIYVGIDGRGIFNQSGGTVTTNWIVLDNRGDTIAGTNMASNLDQYNLSGGILDIKSTWGIVQRNSGEFNLSGGTVRVNNTGTGTGTGANLNIPLDTTINVTSTGSVLDTNGTGNQFTIYRNLNGPGTVTTSGGGKINFSTTTSQGVSAIIAGTDPMVKLGTGTTTMSGASTYTGSTTVSAGTLKAGVASVANTSGAFGNNSAVVMANTAGAILDITGYDTQIGSLTGGGATGGNVTLGAATLTVGGDNTSPAAYAGVISGTGALVKIGSGTEKLSGTNTYTGNTTVSAGILDLTGGGGYSGTIRGSVTVSSGAILRASTGDATGYATDSTRLSTIDLVGSEFNINTTANQTLGSATVNMTGGSITGISGSNLDFFGGASALNTLASSTTSVISPTTIKLRQSSGVTFTVADGAAAVDLRVDSNIIPALDVNGALTKAGDGVMVLTGANTYTTATNVNAGALLVNGTNSGTGLVSVASGATLGGTGSIAGAVNVSGVLSPGASIESLATGSLSMATGSSLLYDLQDTTGAGADLVNVTGDLGLAGVVNLNLNKVGSGTWAINDKLTLLSYTGTWNNNLFTYDGSTIADDDTLTFDGQTWVLNYNDTTAGNNYAAEAAGTYVTLTAIPEPDVAMLIGSFGMLALMRRRR